jgi:hypothetical protein
MRQRRGLGVVVLAVTALAILAAWGWYAGWFGAAGGAPRGQDVPAGDQEVALLIPATSGTIWERFVSAVHQAAQPAGGEWAVDDGGAYPTDQSAGVPEVVVRRRGAGAVRFRWYKVTSDAGHEDWVEALAARNPPPLAVVGGDSSDQAVSLARALADRPTAASGPLLLLLTATADRVAADSGAAAGDGEELMALYPGRTFRCCFSNRQMVRAVVDFLRFSPDLRPGSLLPAVGAVPTLAGGVWAGLPLLAPGIDPRPQPAYSVQWQDDPYSMDLDRRFHEILSGAGGKGVSAGPVPRTSFRLPSSIGGFDLPNRAEAAAAEALAADIPREPLYRSVLVVPAVERPARRLLRALVATRPDVGRSVVAVTGDSIGVDTVYQNGNLNWNIRDLPVPLVFFAHGNPVAWPGLGPPPASGWQLDDRAVRPGGTDSTLVYVALASRLLGAAFADPGGFAGLRPNELAKRLREGSPPFFNPNGDRRDGNGEHIVCLLPRMTDAAEGLIIHPQAVLKVYEQVEPGRWKLIDCRLIDYRPRPPER